MFISHTKRAKLIKESNLQSVDRWRISHVLFLSPYLSFHSPQEWDGIEKHEREMQFLNTSSQVCLCVIKDEERKRRVHSSFACCLQLLQVAPGALLPITALSRHRATIDHTVLEIWGTSRRTGTFDLRSGPRTSRCRYSFLLIFFF